MTRMVGTALLGALLAFTAPVLMSAPAAAHDYTLGPIAIGHPWARATAPSAPNGAAYLSLTCTGSTPDQLLSASSPAARKVELHTHLMDNGVMKMRPVDAIEVVPGSPTLLQPGGLHVMLFGLEKPLAPGSKFPLTLTFRQAGSITVDVHVQDAAKDAGHAEHGDHKPQ